MTNFIGVFEDDINNYNDEDFKELLIHIILNFGPENCISKECSIQKSKNLYRKEAIVKWLKKREKRNFSVYKVKNQHIIPSANIFCTNYN